MEQKHQPYYHCNRTTGNTTIHDLFEEGCSRQMCWDGENRLVSFSDHCKNTGFYQYDAGGERTCKLTWSGNWSSINGTGTVYYLPEGATLYASPYLVVTPQGYTKHYYAEAERITSQLGKGQFADVGTPVVSDSLVQVKLQAVTGNVEYPSTLTIPDSGVFAYLDTLTNQQNATSTLYFYHPDHLGSSSWITTTNGTVKQHLHYLPWGEDFINQRASGYIGARYTFSAKERDPETGLSYFGARYYTSDLSIWLSVDPMSAKYPSLSPYVYCADNPVKLVDPNGEEVWIIGDPPKKQQSFKDKVADFDRKATQVGGAFVMGLAASIPITSTINDMMIVTKGKDMFGKTATDSDKKWSKFSLATCGIGHGMKIIKNVAGKVVISTRKIIENIDKALTKIL